MSCRTIEQEDCEEDRGEMERKKIFRPRLPVDISWIEKMKDLGMENRN